MATASLKITGLKEIKASINTLGDRAYGVAEKAMIESCGKMRDQMRANYSSYNHPWESMNKILLNSISFTVETKKSEVVNAKTGVFDMPTKTGDKRKEYEMPPTEDAWWLEIGVQPHALGHGARAERRETRTQKYAPAMFQDRGVMHDGFKAMPFMSAVYYSEADNALDNLTVKLKQEADKT